MDRTSKFYPSRSPAPSRDSMWRGASRARGSTFHASGTLSGSSSSGGASSSKSRQTSGSRAETSTRTSTICLVAPSSPRIISSVDSMSRQTPARLGPSSVKIQLRARTGHATKFSISSRSLSSSPRRSVPSESLFSLRMLEFIPLIILTMEDERVPLRHDEAMPSSRRRNSMTPCSIFGMVVLCILFV